MHLHLCVFPNFKFQISNFTAKIQDQQSVNYFWLVVKDAHKIKVFPKTGKRGRPKDPIKEPHPDLVYGQVIKERKGSRIIRVTYRIKCGTKRLAQLGLKISTTLLERLNLTLRQSLAPLARKTLGFSKERKNLRKQIVFFGILHSPVYTFPEKACIIELNVDVETEK